LKDAALDIIATGPRIRATKKIVVANNKGGVGKTTVATQIAHSLAVAGNSVVCVDLDSQRNMSTSLEDMSELGDARTIVENGKPIPIALEAGQIGLVKGDADLASFNDDEVMGHVSTALRGMEGADYCVIDIPPSFSVVVYGALLAADYLLVPIELKRYSLDGIEGVLEAFSSIQEHNPDLQLLGLFPSRFDAVKASERATFEDVVKTFPQILIPHAIRNRAAYEEAQAQGWPIRQDRSDCSIFGYALCDGSLQGLRPGNSSTADALVVGSVPIHLPLSQPSSGLVTLGSVLQCGSARARS
jgi:chromosome partitioning protein